MLLLRGGGGGGKKGTKSKKRPLPSPLIAALPQPPPPSQQQQQQQQRGPAAGNDGGSGGGSKRRKRTREEDALIAPWTVVPVAERDILVDRCRKEIAQLLGSGPRAAGTSSDDEEEEDGAEGMKADDGGKKKGKKGRGRRRRERAKVFSAKDGTPTQRYARAHLAIGLNEVMRALERGELALLLLCRDVKPAKVLEPAATLAHVKGTPFFVLPKATAALGEALGLQRVAALGFKRPSGMNAEGGSDEAVRARIKSFLSFVLAKREFMTNAPPLPL